jgi:hypothetical protein
MWAIRTIVPRSVDGEISVFSLLMRNLVGISPRPQRRARRAAHRSVDVVRVKLHASFSKLANVGNDCGRKAIGPIRATVGRFVNDKHNVSAHATGRSRALWDGWRWRWRWAGSWVGSRGVGVGDAWADGEEGTDFRVLVALARYVDGVVALKHCLATPTGPHLRCKYGR